VYAITPSLTATCYAAESNDYYSPYKKDVDVCVEKHHNIGTNDFLVGLVEEHEKTACMIRVHLEGKQ